MFVLQALDNLGYVRSPGLGPLVLVQSLHQACDMLVPKRYQHCTRVILPIGGILNWYYIVAKKERNDRMEDRTWSVGYYGLSPLDTRRGPEGCVTFKYMLKKNSKGLHTIRLMRKSLHSPLDAIKFTETSSPGVEIWSMDTTRLEKFLDYRWIRESVPVTVQSPFVLHFESILEANGAGKYSVKIDDLAVRYMPCEGAISDLRFRCFSRKSSRTLSRSSSTTSMGSPKKYKGKKGR